MIFRVPYLSKFYDFDLVKGKNTQKEILNKTLLIVTMSDFIVYRMCSSPGANDTCQRDCNDIFNIDVKYE